MKSLCSWLHSDTCTTPTMHKIVFGKALVNLSLKDTKFNSGEKYTIVIEKMYELAKADTPLHITGTWEYDFKS